jgi:hypothetical protein
MFPCLECGVKVPRKRCSSCHNVLDFQAPECDACYEKVGGSSSSSILCMECRLQTEGSFRLPCMCCQCSLASTSERCVPCDAIVFPDCCFKCKSVLGVDSEIACCSDCQCAQASIESHLHVYKSSSVGLSLSSDCVGVAFQRLHLVPAACGSKRC